MLLGEVKQLPVLHPCRDGQCGYWSAGTQDAGYGKSHRGRGPRVLPRWETPPKTGHQDKVREEGPPQAHSSSAAGGAGPQGPAAPTTLATRTQRTLG